MSGQKPLSIEAIQKLVASGETPDDVRVIDDKPPNPNAEITKPTMKPPSKPWEKGKKEAVKWVTIFHADAFTPKPFSGNQAAVVVLLEDLPSTTKQAIASEMNLAETAFVRPLTSPISACRDYHLAWFTPTNEVHLCGHATLATSHILFNEIKVKVNELHFTTLGGDLLAKKADNGEIQLDFPAGEPIVFDYGDTLAEMCRGLGLYDVKLVQHSYYCDVTKKALLVVDTNVVLQAQLDKEKLLAIERPEKAPFKGIILTSDPRDNDDWNQYDVVSRYFAPWNGIPEDSVTGSAHTALAPYWCQRLRKDTFSAYQASSRGGCLTVSLDAAGKRVGLAGYAVTTLGGKVRVQ